LESFEDEPPSPPLEPEPPSEPEDEPEEEDEPDEDDDPPSESLLDEPPDELLERLSVA
jgi:hypothetical protein